MASSRPPCPQHHPRHSHPSALSYALALIFAVTLGLTAANADDVNIAGLWYSNVTIQKFANGKIYFQTTAGNVVKKDLRDISSLKVKQLPDIERAEESYDLDEYEAAKEIYKTIRPKVNGKGQPKWLGQWVDFRIVQCAEQVEDVQTAFATDRARAEQILSGDELADDILRIANLAAAMQLEQSYLGRAGKVVEPLFRPLGWDWRVSAAVIAGFPAREVVVAVLGTVYAVGDEADEATLAERLQAATWPDGNPVFTLPMVMGLLIFYACCLQCAATLAVIRRETNTWRWPVFAWFYMTSIGYVGALLVYQLGSA